MTCKHEGKEKRSGWILWMAAVKRGSLIKARGVYVRLANYLSSVTELIGARRVSPRRMVQLWATVCWFESRRAAHITGWPRLWGEVWWEICTNVGKEDHLIKSCWRARRWLITAVASQDSFFVFVVIETSQQKCAAAFLQHSFGSSTLGYGIHKNVSLSINFCALWNQYYSSKLISTWPWQVVQLWICDFSTCKSHTSEWIYSPHIFSVFSWLQGIMKSVATWKLTSNAIICTIAGPICFFLCLLLSKSLQFNVD